MEWLLQLKLCFLEVLMSETKKLPWSIYNELTKDGYGETVPHSEATELVLFNCNIVNNDYQPGLRLMNTFVS